MSPAEITAVTCAAIGILTLAFVAIVLAVLLIAGGIHAARRVADRRPWERPRRTLRYGAPHNLLGHPLLVVVPPLGRWVHNRTRPMVPTSAARLEHRRQDRRTRGRR